MEKFITVGMKIFKEWKNLLELDDKVTLCLGLLSPPLILSSSRIHKVRKFLLYLSMKCSNSASNAQGSKLIIVVVQAGAVKVYVTISGGGDRHSRQKNKERG
jgi:hypothetical protein